MNKVLLITGISSDVGLILARRVASNYDKILAHYCHWSSALEDLKQELGEKAVFLQADFLDPESVHRMISEICKQGLMPDHIVHLPASKTLSRKFGKTAWEDFQNGWEISLHALVDILQAFLPHMGKQKYGKIVVMLTIATYGKPPKYQTSYTTAKYALMGFMRSLASEYEGKGITVNGVSPDMIQTKFLSDLPQLLVEQYEAKCPSKKLLTVDDVVPVFEFLLSESADHVNGANIRIQ